MTIKEIAAKLGLSASTVSRALNHPEMVAPETRVRVEAAVRRHRYRPSTIARSLRVRNSQTIGLILADITNPFHAELARAVEAIARARGFTVILSNSDEDSERERASLETLLSWRVRGLIIAPCGRNQDLLQESLRTGIPVVQVDRVIEGLEADAVLVDNRAGARMAVEHLLELGHRRVAHVAGSLHLTTGARRLEGYRQAMAAGGMAPDEAMVAVGDFREEGGYRATLELFGHSANRNLPTALFVANNEMAAGAIRALGELGLSVPEDVSFVCFDDSRWARLMRPSLTVVAQPVGDMGRTAAELLLRRIESGRQQPTTYTLQPSLVKRQSTAMAPPEASLSWGGQDAAEPPGKRRSTRRSLARPAVT
ncbi:LacI family DNA-binding transcriptional regulator [Carboxydochorda subterranea]|uniref:LacI family DNA-binding transcriptional regulator n=1 Tax=Carboxydichorda subterranea TaxID=3109565 RepID=A0ABZ1BY30_9FIRM|nr:LacI family DNA-binding transcriptional regulator [Limnochorda sp. L945t]WRP17493.1 LacI family DNA-binding transcriptional regulator [Limnochorda sp. L945t]